MAGCGTRRPERVPGALPAGRSDPSCPDSDSRGSRARNAGLHASPGDPSRGAGAAPGGSPGTGLVGRPARRLWFPGGETGLKRGPWECRPDRRAIQSGKPRVSLDCEPPPPPRPRVPVALSLAAGRLSPEKARGGRARGAGQEAGLSVGRRCGGRRAGGPTGSGRLALGDARGNLHAQREGASPALSRAFDHGRWLQVPVGLSNRVGWSRLASPGHTKLPRILFPGANVEACVLLYGPCKSRRIARHGGTGSFPFPLDSCRQNTCLFDVHQHVRVTSTNKFQKVLFLLEGGNKPPPARTTLACG